MKKFLTFILMLIFSVSLFGCDTTNENQDLNIVSNEEYNVDVNDESFDLLDFVTIEYLNQDSQTDGEVSNPENIIRIEYGTFDISTLGDYVVVINVTNSNNVTISKTVTLHVLDLSGPVISLKGNSFVTVEKGGLYTDPGVRMVDNYTTSLSLSVVGFVDTSRAGTYVILYKTMDEAGNESNQITRIVNVVDGDSGNDDTTGDTTGDTGGDTGNDNNQDPSPIDEDGLYTSRDDVALYIYTYNKLPDNYMTKSEAYPHISDYYTSTNKASIGGDEFHNYEGLLPEKYGRTYTEVDIDYTGGSRNAKRIVYSSDGFIFYTSDHYDSFTLYDPDTQTWGSYSKYDNIFD